MGFVFALTLNAILSALCLEFSNFINKLWGFFGLTFYVCISIIFCWFRRQNCFIIFGPNFEIPALGGARGNLSRCIIIWSVAAQTTKDLDGKYLVFTSSCSVKMRGFSLWSGRILFEKSAFILQFLNDKFTIMFCLIYPISANSFRGNYSFLEVEVRKLFKGGNY
jgi:hypothetical protein